MSQRPEIHRDVKIKKKKKKEKWSFKREFCEFASSKKVTKCSDADAVSFLQALQTVVGESGAVEQRNCTVLLCTSAQPCHTGRVAGGPTPRQGLPCWGGDCLVFRLSDQLWLQGLTPLKDQHLGILIRPSTDFNQQGFGEMTEALVIAQLLHTVTTGSSFLKRPATVLFLFPHVQTPEVFLFWLPRTLAFCLFVCRARCKHDFLEAVCAMSFTELEDISLIRAMAAWQYCLLLNLKIKCWCLSFRHHNSIPTLILLLLR